MTVATQGFTLTGERSDLLASLTPAERFISKHGTNTAANGIHILNNAKGCYVEGTDLKMSYRSSIFGAFDSSDVDVVAHPRLRRAVAAMRDGLVTIRQVEGELEVTGEGRARYTAPLLDGTFPNPFPESIDWHKSQAVDVSETLQVMTEASKFVARKEQNPSITGINLRVKDGLAIDATDGYRLYQNQVELPPGGFPFNEQEVILPLAMVVELVKLFPTGEVRFAASTNLFYASNEDGTTLFSCRRIGGKFPEVDRMVPEFKQSTKLPQADTEKALARLRAVGGDRPVSVALSEDQLHLQVRGDEGEAEEWVTLSERVPEELTIGFNSEHLHTAVQLFKGEDEVEFSYLTPLRPALVKGENGKQVLVMPVRIP